MSYYRFYKGIDLNVKGRVSERDAQRQAVTAKEILSRFNRLPGIILADEVGMGKTFVAMAVACSVVLFENKKRRPVVIMVPPSLKEKWPKDFKLFKERCLKVNVAESITSRSVESAIEFLKLLEDDHLTRPSIIFLTHGAMSPQKKLQDRWIKLAVIQRSLYRRHDTKHLKRALCRYLPDILRLKSKLGCTEKFWADMLDSSSSDWLKVMKKHRVELGGSDPVPEAVAHALQKMKLDQLYGILWEKIPLRSSPNVQQRLSEAREIINKSIDELWKLCIRSLRVKLPLLILDEAHHLKNPRTQLASLFHTQEAQQDAEEITRGPLAHVFERMLFLTATPFQLGHYELCSILERFRGVSWTGRRAPATGISAFDESLEIIRERLDAAQEAAVRLDVQWGQLRQEDLFVDGRLFERTEEWWEAALKGGKLAPQGQAIIERYRQTDGRMRLTEEILSHYIIRHTRPRKLFFPFENVPRRVTYSGRSILDEKLSEDDTGLEVAGETLLPFLLAARVATLKPESRPVFAEGLASSFEAFMSTRIQKKERVLERELESLTDMDDDKAIPENGQDKVAAWYLDQLEDAIAHGRREGNVHPKLNATVNKTVDLWRKREKVLVFCHYLATGGVLERDIREAIDREIEKLAASRTRVSSKKALEELDRVGELFNKKDSPIRKGLDRAVGAILDEYALLHNQKAKILDIVRRYARSRSFLARYFPLGEEKMTEKMAFDAMRRKDASGMSFEELIRNFLRFLVIQCGEDERERYIDALEAIHTFQGHVRLVNGKTDAETRQRLMLTFNTPFYPEILISSMVMAEGVDLHMNCRHVIHHDLCWNPSTLEQRTGRIDRIGAKVENCGKPVAIYLPYISQTQDEKMYRVVMDRERWFKVIMGEQYKVDVRTTDKLAERLPFPEAAASALALKLNVCES